MLVKNHPLTIIGHLVATTMRVFFSRSPIRLPNFNEAYLRNTGLLIPNLHLNENVFNLTKFSSVSALIIANMTTFIASNDENFVEMRTFTFQCLNGSKHCKNGRCLRDNLNMFISYQCVKSPSYLRNLFDQFDSFVITISLFWFMGFSQYFPGPENFFHNQPLHISLCTKSWHFSHTVLWRF